MSRIIQFKRFGAAALANTVGANGEIIVNLTTKGITLHDGLTAGGFSIQTDNVARVLANAAFLQANTTNVTAESAFARANLANILAQAAFSQANTALISPQNPQTANYILQLSDAGKHIYYTQSSNVILYIPTTSNVAFSNGTTIMIVSRTSSGANVTVSPNTGVSMFLAGNTTSASRNVTTHGVVTLINVAANTWFISGSGVV
jgi:hypothetical protein